MTILKRFKNPYIKKSYIPFVFLGIGMLVVHMFLPIPTGDDYHFSFVPNGILDFSYYKTRYLTWSSRIFLDFLIVTMLNLPYQIWRIANSLLFVLLGISISKLFVKENNIILNWLIVFLLFIYPFRDLSDTGWVTTTMIYLWPLSLGLYAMTIIRKVIVYQEVRKSEYILASILLIYSTNLEILSIIFLFFFLFVSIRQIIQKKPNWYIICCLGLCILSIIFSFASPGTIRRSNVEVRWFVDYGQISLIDKIEIGLSSTFYHFIFNFNLLFIFLCILLLISIRYIYDDPFIRIISAIPFIITLIWGVLIEILSPLFSIVQSFDPEISKYGIISLFNFTDLGRYLFLIVLYSAAFLIPLLLYIAFENSLKSLLAVGIIFLGFISRIMFSFSPTIWASGERTFFFMSVSIIICCVMLMENLLSRDLGQLVEKLNFSIGIIGLLSYINLVISL